MAEEVIKGSLSTYDEFFGSTTCDDEPLGEQINGFLKLGAKYSSFQQLQKAVHCYCHEKKVRLFRSDSRKLMSAHIRVNPTIIEKAPECLIYYSLTYSCVFGSKSFKKRNKDTSSVISPNNKGCKFVVRIGLTKDCQCLEVIKMSDPTIHNHITANSVRKGFNLKSFKSQDFLKTKTLSNVLQDPDDTQICLSDLPSNPMHLRIISTRLCEYRRSGLFCDTVINSSDGTLYAHGVILAMFCPKLFSSLNKKPFQKYQSNLIDLSRYPSSLINKLLDFFYLGKLCMEQFDGLQDLASHLGVIFNIDKPHKEISFNKGLSSTRISSECEDHIESECLIAGQK